MDNFTDLLIRLPLVPVPAFRVGLLLNYSFRPAFTTCHDDLVLRFLLSHSDADFFVAVLLPSHGLNPLTC